MTGVNAYGSPVPAGFGMSAGLFGSNGLANEVRKSRGWVNPAICVCQRPPLLTFSTTLARRSTTGTICWAPRAQLKPTQITLIVQADAHAHGLGLADRGVEALTGLAGNSAHGLVDEGPRT